MKKPLILINFVSILLGISYGMVDPIFPIFAKNVIDATYVEIGFLGLADTIPYAFIPIFVGFLLYRYNNGRLLTIGIILNVASIYLLSLAQSLHEVVILVFMAGVGYAFFWPPCTNIIANQSNEHNGLRNRVIFHGFFTAGMVIGPLFGALFFSYMDTTFTIIFQMAAIILAVGIILSIPLSKKHICVDDIKLSVSSLNWIKKFPLIVIIVLYCSACFGIVFTIHPVFLDENALEESHIEILYFVLGMSRIITLINTNKISKRSNYAIIAAVTSIALGMLIAFFAEGIIEFALSMMLLGFGISIFLPLALEIILSKTKGSVSSVIIGTFEAIFGLGWIIGSMSAGILYQYWEAGIHYPIFFILGIMITVFALIKKHTLNIEKTGQLNM